MCIRKGLGQVYNPIKKRGKSWSSGRSEEYGCPYFYFAQWAVIGHRCSIVRGLGMYFNGVLFSEKDQSEDHINIKEIIALVGN